MRVSVGAAERTAADIEALACVLDSARKVEKTGLAARTLQPCYFLRFHFA